MHPNKLNHSKALQFILGGNAVFTVKSLKTSTRFTYKVAKPEDDNSWTDSYFVKLLTGPDEYTYVGMITDQEGFKLTKGSKMTSEAQSVKIIEWTINKYLFKGLTNHEGDLEIWHEGRCGRCNRELTVPSSIESGFGPECSKRMRG